MKAAFRLLIIVVCCGFLAACGKAELKPLAAQDRVLAFGDSLTFGTGAGQDESYPNQLANRIGREVVNAGVPGETTSDALARLPDALEETRPALVILCLGGNDFLQRLPPDATAANLRTMIEQIRRQGAQVLLVGVPRPGLLLEADEVYADLASALDVPLEDEALARILAKPSLKSDTVHPNAAGYRQLAEAIADRLSELGAIR
ncbi:arylesterase [Chitinibacteraceae bacterium HSL-7]